MRFCEVVVCWMFFLSLSDSRWLDACLFPGMISDKLWKTHSHLFSQLELVVNSTLIAHDNKRSLMTRSRCCIASTNLLNSQLGFPITLSLDDGEDKMKQERKREPGWQRALQGQSCLKSPDTLVLVSA